MTTTCAEGAAPLTGVRGAARSGMRQRVTQPRLLLAAEAMIVFGLVALGVGLLALRMTLLPPDVLPRDLALTGFAVATIGALGAFVGAGLLQARSARRTTR